VTSSVGWARAVVGGGYVRRLRCLRGAAGLWGGGPSEQGAVQPHRIEDRAYESEQDAYEGEEDAGVEVSVEPLPDEIPQHDRHRQGDAELGCHSEGLNSGDGWPCAICCHWVQVRAAAPTVYQKTLIRRAAPSVSCNRSFFGRGRPCPCPCLSVDVMSGRCRVSVDAGGCASA